MVGAKDNHGHKSSSGDLSSWNFKLGSKTLLELIEEKLPASSSSSKKSGPLVVKVLADSNELTS